MSALPRSFLTNMLANPKFSLELFLVEIDRASQAFHQPFNINAQMLKSLLSKFIIRFEYYFRFHTVLGPNQISEP